MSSTQLKIKIGLEIHVQLSTQSKLFCGCSTAPSGTPNSNVCEICLGMPGSKPTVNKRAVEYALRAALALNCAVNKNTYFARKTYFYPDMNKNFQITQYEIPIAENGFLKIGEREKKVRIRRIHLEEDPAKLTHVGKSITTSRYTLIDYNRAGIPLIEIVTEPDLHSENEARTFLRELTRILEYLEIYDASSEFSLKADVNVSVSDTRVELKNITGVRAVEEAIKEEIARQLKTIKRGGKISQETRGYDAKSKTTYLLRKKETEEDYGYIFEPDLPVIHLSESMIGAIRKKLPELPRERLERLKKLGLRSEIAQSLITDKGLCDAFESLLKKSLLKKKKYEMGWLASWFSGVLKKSLNYRNLNFRQAKIKTEWIEYLLTRVNKEISERTAELVLRKIIEKPIHPKEMLKGEEKPSSQELERLARQVIGENKKAVEDYRNGRKGALNFLVGQLIRATKGRADPKKARELIERELKD